MLPVLHVLPTVKFYATFSPEMTLMLLITCQRCTLSEHLRRYMKCKILEIVCDLLLWLIEGFEYWGRL